MKNRAVILERVKAERDRICDIAARHGAYNIRIFGSVAREEVGNDLDLLIDLEPDRSLLDLVALKSELEALLPRRCCRVRIPALVYQGPGDGGGGAAVRMPRSASGNAPTGLHDIPRKERGHSSLTR